MTGRVRSALLCWGAVLSLASAPAVASPLQDPPAAQAGGEQVTEAQVQRSLEALKTDPRLAQAARDRLSAIYEEALGRLTTAADWSTQAAEFERSRTEAPAALAALRAELDEPVAEAEIVEPPDATLSELEQSLTQAEAELTAARKRVENLEAEQQHRDERRSEVPDALADARARLDEVETELAEGAAPDTDEDTRAAERTRDLARRQAILAEIEAYDRELLSYDDRTNLLAARRERAARRLARADELARQWREVVNDRRRIEAERDARTAQAAAAEAATSHALVLAWADKNTQLAERRTGSDGLLSRIETAVLDAERISAELLSLREDSESVHRKVVAAGKTPAIGLMLVDQRKELPVLRTHKNALGKRRIESAKIQLEKIDIADEADRLVDIDKAVKDEVRPLVGELTESELTEIRRALREQFQLRRRLLLELSSDYSDYVDMLVELDGVETELIRETTEFAAYIDELVLWVRTAAPLHTEVGSHWRQAMEAAAWLFDASTWRVLLGRSTSYLVEMPLSHAPHAVQLLVLALLVLWRRGIRRRIANDAYLVGRIRTDRFMHTVHALVFTALRALPLPLLLWCLGSMLATMSDIPLAEATANGLRATAGACLAAEFVWAACRSGGLADAHFRWPSDRLQLLRRHLRWLVWIGLPAVFIVSALEWRGSRSQDDSLGRLAFLVGHLALSVFAYRVLRPSTGVLATALERNPTGWLSRLRFVWFPLAVGLPVLLAVMAELGYVYTAHQLTQRMQASAFLVVGLVAVHAMLLRWLFVARRQLALQQYRKRRAAAQADAGEPRSMSSMSDEFVEEESIDIPTMSAQSQRLVQVLIGVSLLAGLLIIWADVLPALGVFDEVELWSHAVEVEERDPGPDGTETVMTVRKLVPVTLADLLMAIVALVLTVAAARNVPGLLEITVLQRLPLQRAGRYAVTTISRYLISIIGIVLVFGAVGIGWSKVQWLAAAVTVGLGFGLQEIFANFVSGLILLFERPIRIGDTVTVGEVTGTVTKIHMRATTIMTWDRTELVVPNREFITSQLVNWTLTDSVLRVIIKVGIAYGSDTAKAEQILRKIAAENPDVLDEPAPRIVFDAFGESSLDFELRVFVADPELYRRIQHPLNNAIDAEFRAAGIEIAFPQRDLHLRTVDVAVPVSRGEARASEETREGTPTHR